MYSNIVFANSVRVFHRFRLSSSICIEDQNDSIIALPGPSPTVPNEGSRPAERIFWVNTHEVNWTGVVGMNDPARTLPACANGHVQGIDHQRGVLLGIDGPADHLAATGIEHCGAENFSFSCRMLRDIGDPQLVHREAMELPIHQAIGRGDPLEALDTGGPGEVSDSRTSHQDGDEPTRAGDAHADGELGVDAPVAISAAGCHVDLADQAGQPAAAQLRGAGGTLTVSVEP